MLLLTRLSDAQRHGYPVLAVVRGSAVNQDGASNGLSAPHGPSQVRVIRQALGNARLTPEQVDVVEAHGTGTRLGDPIEAQALLATYGQDRDEAAPLLLGSVKSNIGHTQAAAGVAGVIKMVMAMRHGVVPPTLHVDEPSPQIDWTAGAVTLATAGTPWPAVDRPRRAAVSSFGVSGTNAHTIIEQAPAPAEAEAEPKPRRRPARWPPCCSPPAPTPRSPRRPAAGPPGSPPTTPCARSTWPSRRSTSRSTLDRRAVLSATGRDDLLAGLRALAAGEPAGTVVLGAGAPRGQLAVLFSGQGAQRAGMGRELYAEFPVFAAALDEACGHLDRALPRPLREVLFAAEGSADAESAGPDGVHAGGAVRGRGGAVPVWSSPSGSPPTWSAATRSVRSRPRTWRGCCRWSTPARWWRRGAG